MFQIIRIRMIFDPYRSRFGLCYRCLPENVGAIIEQVSGLPFMFILRRFIEALAIPLILAFSTLFIAKATAQSQSSPAPRGDNQFWSEMQLSVPINNRTDLVLLGVARFGRNVSRPVNERIGAGIL